MLLPSRQEQMGEWLRNQGFKENESPTVLQGGEGQGRCHLLQSKSAILSHPGLEEGNPLGCPERGQPLAFPESPCQTSYHFCSCLSRVAAVGTGSDSVDRCLNLTRAI